MPENEKVAPEYIAIKSSALILAGLAVVFISIFNFYPEATWMYFIYALVYFFIVILGEVGRVHKLYPEKEKPPYVVDGVIVALDMFVTTALTLILWGALSFTPNARHLTPEITITVLLINNLIMIGLFISYRINTPKKGTTL